MRRSRTSPPPDLPYAALQAHVLRMPNPTEFGGGEYNVRMKTEISINCEIVSPPFSSACPDALCRGRTLRDANGGAWNNDVMNNIESIIFAIMYAVKNE